MSVHQSSIIKNPDLHDAQAASKLPNGPAVPDWYTLSALQVGVCVKVGVGTHGQGSEAFWVELQEVTPSLMVGIIVNNLKFTSIHGLEAGDAITVQKGNVFQVHA
jgi:hypothetical protein